MSGSAAAGAVAALFARLGEPVPDAEVLDYLANTLADEDTEPDVLLDTLLGFSPRLGQLSHSEQVRLVMCLMEGVRAAATADGAAADAAAQRPATPTAQGGAATAAAAPLQPGLGRLSLSDRSASGAATAAGSQGPSSRGGSACSTPSAAAAATAGQAEDTAAVASKSEVAALETLRALCPVADAEPAFLLHALRSRCGGSLEAAAAWLLDAAEELPGELAAWRRQREAAAAAAAAAAAEREALRRQIVSRYQLEAVPAGDGGAGGRKRQELKAWQGKEAQSKARYRDGQLVSTKGEKYIVERVGEEWDGGSRGKGEAQREALPSAASGSEGSGGGSCLRAWCAKRLNGLLSPLPSNGAVFSKGKRGKGFY